jgi:Mannosyl-glycoprotein endo-beta-N-acetylglucosaminidase
MRGAGQIIIVIVFAGSTPACGAATSRAPTAPSPSNAIPIMGTARLSHEQLVAWFNGRQPRPGGSYAASVPVEVLARYFVEEGAAEGVTGDVAFIQSIVETSWFRFTGLVPASANNFAGIGATDANPQPAMFADARTGVRAQIQHLRAYGDPTAVTCTVPPLHNRCADPRFDLVVPKGKAPTWNQLGNGNWASAGTYGVSILRLYDEAQSFRTSLSAKDEARNVGFQVPINQRERRQIKRRVRDHH